MYSDESSIYHHKAATVTVTSFDEDDEGRTPKKGNGRWTFYVCYACIYLANFTCDVSFTVMALVLPVSRSTAGLSIWRLTFNQNVSKDLRLTAIQTLWIPGSLMLSAALAQPLFMRLSLALGCKTMLLFGLGIFTIGNVVSGLSQNATNMLVGTLIAGAGVGIVSVLTKLTLGQISPSPPSICRMMIEKPASQVFWLGIALGPLIGKCLLDTTGWRSVFWVQIHFSLVAFVGLAACLQLPYVVAGSTWQSLAKVDFAGWLLLSASVAPITVSISLAGSAYSWSSHQVLLAVVFGSIAFGLWCAYTRFWRAENPLLPLSIFRNGSAVVAAMGALAQGAILMTLIYFLPIFWQASEAGLSSLSLAPWTFTLAILGLVAAAVTSHTGYRSLIWAGWALVTLSTGLAILFKASSPTTFSIPVGLLGGTGIGLLLPALNTALSATASNDDESIHAAPLHTFAWTLGASLGLTISSGIFLNGLSLPQPLQVHNIFYLIGDLAAMPPYQSALKAELIDAIVSSTRTLWIAGCIVSGIAFLLSFWFLEDHMPQPRTIELD